MIAFALAISGCSQGSSAKDSASRQSAPLGGAWHSQVKFRSGPLAEMKNLEFLYAFNADGTMTESSNYDEAANSSPPAYGVWRQVAPRKFEAKYVFFTTKARSPGDGAPTATDWWPGGHGELTETISLSENGQSSASAIKLTLFNLEGVPIGGTSEGTGAARRISFSDVGG